MSTFDTENEGDLYVVSWDQLGMEALVNVTELERQKTWAILSSAAATGYNNLGSIVNQLILRARYNPQRHYEIYSFSVQEGIEEQDIQQMFNDSPQHAADTIRRIGSCIYSDRQKQSEIKII